MPQTQLTSIFSKAASGGKVDERQLFEAASIFGRPLYRAIADLKTQIEVCSRYLKGPDGSTDPEQNPSVIKLLGAAVVIGGCRTVLRSAFSAAKSLEPEQPVRQSLQFRLVGLQAEQEAVTALLIELLESLTLVEQRIDLLLKASVEHLIKVRALETVLQLSGEGFDSEVIARMRTEHNSLLTAAAALFPKGIGAETIGPIAKNIGLVAAD